MPTATPETMNSNVISPSLKFTKTSSNESSERITTENNSASKLVASLKLKFVV